MKSRSLLVSALLLLAGSLAPAIAKQAGGPPSVAQLPLWTAKGYPTSQFAPGLTAALLLTPEQREQLARAWQETSGSEAVAAATRTLKLDPSAPEARKQAARAVTEAAASKLQQRIEAILTPDQKAWIERINRLHAEVGRAEVTRREGEYATAKGDREATARLQQQMEEEQKTAFRQRLQAILTPKQWTAMTQAAEEEKPTEGGKGKAKV